MSAATILGILSLIQAYGPTVIALAASLASALAHVKADQAQAQVDQLKARLGD